MKTLAFTTSVVACALLLSGVDALFLEQAPEKRYPVSKVVQLLQDMKTQLEKEADMDEEVYEKLACWCQTNDKEKTKSIADAEAHISDLTSAIEKTTALSATLNVEIEAQEKEIAENQKSLEIAIALREKQAAAFLSEEKEMIESIKALDAAIIVLSKHHGSPSLLDKKTMAAIAAAASMHKDILQGALLPHEQRMLTSFTQQPDYFSATPTFKQTYAPQSGEIYGILREMKSTFESNLAESQSVEVQDKKTFVELKAAKETEIKNMQNSLEDKREQLASADEKLVQSKDDRADTQVALGADEKFLMELKNKCSMTDAEWEERQKMRQAELSAVSEAISILSTDDARELFSKVFNPEPPAMAPAPAAPLFVQTESRQIRHNRERAAALLERLARKTHSLTLAALAASVNLDAFTRVKKAIDDMMAQITKEKADEIVFRDSCISQLNSNELSTDKELHTKEKLESHIDTQELEIKELETTIKTLQAEIAELQAELMKAKANRALEKDAFKATIADQEQTITLLTQALEKLKKVYTSPVVLTQKENVKSEQIPPTKFSTYEKQGASSGVLAMIQQIITDAKLMQAEAMKAEGQAKDALTQLVQETTAAVEAKQAAIIDRTQEKAKADQELLQAKEELQGSVSELEALTKSAADLHGNCDFLLKNFDIRQAARDEEVEALRQAKAYLSGMQG